MLSLTIVATVKKIKKNAKLLKRFEMIVFFCIFFSHCCNNNKNAEILSFFPWNEFPYDDFQCKTFKMEVKSLQIKWEFRAISSIANQFEVKKWLQRIVSMCVSKAERRILKRLNNRWNTAQTFIRYNNNWNRIQPYIYGNRCVSYMKEYGTKWN